LELSASFSGNDEEYDTCDDEHTIFNLDLHTIKPVSKILTIRQLPLGQH
jgi:hypothetical protein